MAFWTQYWADHPVPSAVDPGFSFEQCLAWALLERLNGCSGELLENGCARGKWCAYLNQHLGLLSRGIEYSPTGLEVTERKPPRAADAVRRPDPGHLASSCQRVGSIS